MRIVFITILSIIVQLAPAQDTAYLSRVKTALQQKWPANRTINLVFHGHSVPSGYFNTPNVRTLDAYPQLVLQALKQKYPYAVVNVITTAIGGENSSSGAKRFKKEVLPHRPDVLFIDYTLNDRRLGLAQTEKNWRKMIRWALKKKIPVILLTPSPDISVEWTKTDNELARLTALIVRLANEYGIGLADSYSAFINEVNQGRNIKEYMSQSNHPNRKGHELIAAAILQYF